MWLAHDKLEEINLIQEKQLLFLLDTEFSLQNGHIVSI